MILADFTTPSLNRAIQALNRKSMLDAVWAKILVLDGQAVLSDLRTLGAPLYSIPARGNWLERVHKFAARHSIQIMDIIYIRQSFRITQQCKHGK